MNRDADDTYILSLNRVALCPSLGVSSLEWLEGSILSYLTNNKEIEQMERRLNNNKAHLIIEGDCGN